MVESCITPGVCPPTWYLPLFGVVSYAILEACRDLGGVFDEIGFWRVLHIPHGHERTCVPEQFLEAGLLRSQVYVDYFPAVALTAHRRSEDHLSGIPNLV
jgi:hypothetical protein